MTKPQSLSRLKFEAYLGSYSSFWGYLMTYQNAFNSLIEDVERNDLHVDRISYPMLFMVRHSLELGFKANIRFFAKYSERHDFTNSDSHDLGKLFGAFKLHVNSTIENLRLKYSIDVDEGDKSSFEEYCSEVEKLTEQMDFLDKGSFSFRYPVDKRNKSVFKATEKVNLVDIKELYDNAMVLLFYTSTIFKKYILYATEIEAAYEEEIRRAYGDL